MLMVRSPAGCVDPQETLGGVEVRVTAPSPALVRVIGAEALPDVRILTWPTSVPACTWIVVPGEATSTAFWTERNGLVDEPLPESLPVVRTCRMVPASAAAVAAVVAAPVVGVLSKVAALPRCPTPGIRTRADSA